MDNGHTALIKQNRNQGSKEKNIFNIKNGNVYFPKGLWCIDQYKHNIF